MGVLALFAGSCISLKKAEGNYINGRGAIVIFPTEPNLAPPGINRAQLDGFTRDIFSCFQRENGQDGAGGRVLIFHSILFHALQVATLLLALRAQSNIAQLLLPLTVTSSEN